MKYSTIIWDWNGTLIDDVDICVDCINVLLKKRNLPLLDLNKYREVFRFPVKEYYEEVGFDFTREPYAEVASEFIEIYLTRLKEADLHKDVKKTLDIIRQKGKKQAVLSAMEHDNLVKSIKEKGIYPYFHLLMGIQDHFAHGKIENAKRIVESLGNDPTQTLLIGDTLHDWEVANEIGCDALLLSHGHQSSARLSASGCLVATDLAGVLDVLNL